MSTPRSYVSEWVEMQQTKAPIAHHAASHDSNLGTEIDIQFPFQLSAEDLSDFSSSDTLGLSSSGELQAAFLDELARCSDLLAESTLETEQQFPSCVAAYQETLEHEIAAFHGAETAVLAVNAGLAHLAVFTALPRPGDAIVCDEYIHAALKDCIRNSTTVAKKLFRHNDVDSFVETLILLRDSQPLVRTGEQNVIIVIEAVYHMTGDVAPLHDLVVAAEAVLPAGNYHFYVDETHSTGVLEPRGAGLVCALRLEEEIAVRVHSCPSELASGGAAILCRHTIKSTIQENACDKLPYEVANVFVLMIIKAGYNLLSVDTLQQNRDKLAYLSTLLKNEILSSLVFKRAVDAHMVRVPQCKNDNDSDPTEQFSTPTLSVLTRPNTQYHLYLSLHLQLAGFIVHPVSFPLIPRGTEGVRIVLRVAHTDAEVKALGACICSWAEEMLSFEDGGREENVLPTAVRSVYNMTQKERKRGSEWA